MAVYTVFNADGTRRRLVSKPDADGPPKVGKGRSYLPGEIKNKLFVNKVLIDKPESKITLIGTKLENLPNPTTVTIAGNGATFRRTITDGIYEFTLDMPGEYMIKCESKVELPITFDLEVI